ncbi:hypothetical protein PPL_03414 [Heterostelium album PN500]|uniref:Uncharacterized protein n=1 Tax=Heterostelium pallidum (strain ATCC 26659 / Pp 5 / PN500) TaxID=670386 RepID=D3B4T8_HETP5|nr:hypothetical protein PPL_03414 [Heterostelium album PN500]EFA84336.1 hypothetical protein PPL_03414 [Heterostelium album PN500]|eukprot:XP_020436451.1 hypothetical protein PPL_03414 [Heterostelium album PN500]
MNDKCLFGLFLFASLEADILLLVASDMLALSCGVKMRLKIFVSSNPERQPSDNPYPMA